MYINIETEEILTRAQLEGLFPETSLPAPPVDLSDIGYAFILTEYAFILTEERPEGEVVEPGPVLKREDGKFYYTWQVRSFNEEELERIFQRKKNSFIQGIERKVKSALEKGIPYDFPNAGILHIQLRDGDRANLSGMRVIAIERPHIPQSFRTYENIVVPLTAEQVVDMTDAALFGYTDILQQAWLLKDSLEEATNEDSLMAVWHSKPEIFN